MMFDKLTVDLILQGKKTQTRRLRKDDNNPPAVQGKIHKLKIDRTQKVYGYIEILSCEKGKFGDLSLSDARKEGFDSVDEYTDYFESVNGKVNKSTPIWIVNFKLVRTKKQYILRIIKNYLNYE